MKTLRGIFLASTAALWIIGWIYTLVPAVGLVLQNEDKFWVYPAFFAWLVFVYGMATGYIPQKILVHMLAPLWKEYWWIIGIGVVIALISGFAPLFSFLASLEGTAHSFLAIVVGVGYVVLIGGIVVWFVRTLFLRSISKNQRKRD